MILEVGFLLKKEFMECVKSVCIDHLLHWSQGSIDISRQTGSLDLATWSAIQISTIVYHIEAHRTSILSLNVDQALLIGKANFAVLIAFVCALLEQKTHCRSA